MLRALLTAIAACLLMTSPAAARSLSTAAPKPTAADVGKLSAAVSRAASFAARDVKVTCPDRAAGGRRITPVSVLYLTVRNDGTVPITVLRPELLAPSDLVLCAPAPVPGSAIAPGRSRTVALTIGATGTPRTGIVPLLVAVHFAGTVAGRVVDDQVLVSDEAQLTVPGLSDALKLFGAPTLFLLPGVLVLGAFGMLYQPKNPALLAAGGASFWIISVMIALGISITYGLGQRLFGSDHNLFDRYDLGDVGVIWAVSLAIGWGAGATLRARAAAEQARATAEQARVAAAAKAAADALTPRHSDDPLTFLTRLAKLDAAVTNRWYAAGGAHGFLVSGKPLEARWLMPQITHRPRKLPATDLADWDAARSGLAALSATAELKPAAVLQELGKPVYAALLPLAWNGGVEPHALLATDDLIDRGERLFAVIRG